MRSVSQYVCSRTFCSCCNNFATQRRDLSFYVDRIPWTRWKNIIRLPLVRLRASRVGRNNLTVFCSAMQCSCYTECCLFYFGRVSYETSVLTVEQNEIVSLTWTKNNNTGFTWFTPFCPLSTQLSLIKVQVLPPPPAWWWRNHQDCSVQKRTPFFTVGWFAASHTFCLTTP